MHMVLHGGIIQYIFVDYQIAMMKKKNIILHVGEKDGIVKNKKEDASSIYCSKNISSDYYDNMEALLFKKCIFKKLLPLIKEPMAIFDGQRFVSLRTY